MFNRHPCPAGGELRRRRLGPLEGSGRPDLVDEAFSTPGRAAARATFPGNAHLLGSAAGRGL